MEEAKIPDIIFIVPYRDRYYQRTVFLNHMKVLLEDINYEIIIAHQFDRRFFNRGAMKNLGFMHAREKYPDNYKDITFVFHDIDILVGDKSMTNFQTEKGVVKHIFGFKQTFGGIFSIKGSDFELINGFPCIWNWGYEDNAIRGRWVKMWETLNRQQKRTKLPIDYSEFHAFDKNFKDKRIVMLYHGDKKIFNRTHAWNTFKNAKNYIDGIKTLKNIQKKEQKLSTRVSMVNISRFTPLTPHPSKAEKKALITKADLTWKPKRVKPPPHFTKRSFGFLQIRRK